MRHEVCLENVYESIVGAFLPDRGLTNARFVIRVGTSPFLQLAVRVRQAPISSSKKRYRLEGKATGALGEWTAHTAVVFTDGLKVAESSKKAAEAAQDAGTSCVDDVPPLADADLR